MRAAAAWWAAGLHTLEQRSAHRRCQQVLIAHLRDAIAGALCDLFGASL
jgi:hypothetical protein